MNSLSSHRAFSCFKYGKLRTTGMSLYRDKYGNGPAAPTSGRAAGLRGLRFRTPADDEPEAFEGTYVEPEEEVVTPEPEVLIPAEGIPAPTPTTAPEKDEVERCALVDECEGLVLELSELPGGGDEVNRLVEETGCTGPEAPLGKLRAFKIRLEGALVRLTIQHREELGIPFAGDNARRQE